jgi:hypothetical protein
LAHVRLLHLLTTGYDVVDGARSRRRIAVR